jgi:hypothetical protein
VPSSAALLGGEPAHWRISVAWLGLDPPKRSPAKLALDWSMFIKGFHPAWAWRIGLTVLGGVLYASFVWFALMELRPFIGSDPICAA